MNDAVLNIVITHGSLAASIQAVVARLVSTAPEFHCFSNQEKSFEEIEAQILELIKKTKPQRIMIFVDLMGGSCWMSASKLKHQLPEISFAAGVNVPMLVSYCINLDRLPWEELLLKIAEDAKKGVLVK